MENQPSGKEEDSKLTREKDDAKSWKLKGYLALGILLLVVALGAAGIQTVSRNEFCVSCHEIQPRYLSWQLSSHSTVDCSMCHVPVGWEKALNFRLHTVRQFFSHVIGGQEKQIVVHNPIENDNCLQCHSANRLTTPSGDIRIPHDRHMTEGIRCVECHDQVVHSKVGEKLELLAMSDITAQDLSQHISVKDSRPAMNRCLECHNERQVSISCETCHEQVRKPDSHLSEDWNKVHGLSARENLMECNKCHSYTNASANATPEEVKDYARGNVFCATCHQQRPAGHGDDWRISHKQSVPYLGVNHWDRTGCLVCHNENQPGPQEQVAKTYCSKCHGASNLAEGTPTDVLTVAGPRDPFRTHPLDWRQIHPNFVKTKGITQGKCFTCHENIHCSKCHTSQRGPSPM